jgi:general secretion pathway protein L
MNVRTITAAFSSWMQTVATLLVAMAGRFRSPGRLRLIEEAGGVFKVEAPRRRGAASFGDNRLRIVDGSAASPLTPDLAAALRGSRVELILRSDRFLSRALELPKRATEFLDGIVRAQIDRLTPWTAEEAAFGWTAPRELAKDRVELTVVATARAVIAPYLKALVDLGAGSIAVSTVPQGASGAAEPVKVLEHGARGALDVQRVRTVLAAIFIGLALSAGIALAATQFISDALDAQQQDVLRRIAERRASMRRQDVTGALPAQRVLERRKRETPSSIMVIEALSQILPDHTYVTELRIEGDKLQVIGITQDAPSLIRLIEQSPHFTRATFFAPTTRSSGDPGERFHIEARIRPVFSART